MAVFILETDNPSRRIIRSLLYISSINMGRTTTSILKVRPEEESKTVGRGGVLQYNNIGYTDICAAGNSMVFKPFTLG